MQLHDLPAAFTAGTPASAACLLPLQLLECNLLCVHLMMQLLSAEVCHAGATND